MNIGNKALNQIKKKIKKEIILRAIVDYKNISSIILFLKSGFNIKSCDTRNLVMSKKII